MADISVKIKSDFEQAEKDFQDLAKVSENTRAKIKKFSDSFKTEQIDKFRERNRMAAVAISATRGKVAGMRKEANGLRSEIERLIKRGLSPQDEAVKKLTTDYARLQSEIGKTAKKTGGLSKVFGDGVKKMAMYAAGFMSLRAVGSLFKSIVNNARKLEDATAAFTPLMGGAEKAEKLVKALNVAAAETPFKFEGIQKAVSTLLPVMDGDIEKTIDTFKMLGDTAGGNQQKLESVTRGFTKAMLKGKVDMESLNMIAEAGVPIFNEMAESMGYGKDEMSSFFKQISSGKVSTDEMVKAFQKMTSEGGLFYQGMIIASKTTSGVLSTLSDNLAMVAAGIGQAFLPYIKEAAIWITQIASDVLKWINTGDNLQRNLEAIGIILSIIGSALAAYIIYAKSAAAAQWILNAAMAANPIGLLIAAITALIAVGVLLYKNWDLVKLKMISVFGTLETNALLAWEKIKFGFLVAIQAIISGVFSLAAPFANVINGMIKAFNLITGKNIPTLEEGFKSFTKSMDKSLKTSANNIARLQKQRKIDQRAAELAAKMEAKSEKEKTSSLKNSYKEQQNANKQKNQAIKKGNSERAKSFKDMLDAMEMSNEAHLKKNILDTQKFFTDRSELEGNDHESRIEFLQKQLEQIRQMEGVNANWKMALMKGVTEAISKENEKRLGVYAQFGQHTVGTTKGLVQDLITVFKNAGKSTRALAYTLKGVSMAEAAINSYVAFTKALAAFPWPFNMVAAGITLAAGLAKQAAIASTPIPSGQTGLDYTVPDTPAMRHDGAAVRASAGEQVSITPRGEESSRSTVVNIDVGETNLFRIIQKGIDTGRINISNRNIGAGVFAT